MMLFLKSQTGATKAPINKIRGIKFDDGGLRPIELGGFKFDLVTEDGKPYTGVAEANLSANEQPSPETHRDQIGPGRRVTLISGGPVMSVRKCSESTAHCIWHDSGLQRGEIPIDLLRVVEHQIKTTEIERSETVRCWGD